MTKPPHDGRRHPEQSFAPGQNSPPQNIVDTKAAAPNKNGKTVAAAAKEAGLASAHKAHRNAPLVLIVEDERSMLMMLESRLTEQGYNVITAMNGKTACHHIEKYHQKIDAILLDRMMPGMDGLQVVQWMKSRTDITQVPIIMQTGSDQPDQIKEGIDAGVFYYLTKPIQEDILKSVLFSAVKESKQKRILRKELEKHKVSFSLIHNARFFLKNLEEAEDLACFIANSFPESDKVLPGIAELFINAIEHGKCKITYDQKTELIKLGKWRTEVTRRCNLDAIKDKAIEVIFERKDNRYSVKISDSGEGFPWRKYMNVDPSRAMDNHGRGIARANMIFDGLSYNDEGNVVVAVIDASVRKSFEW